MEKLILVEGLVLPNKALSNFELIEAVKKLKIPNFRGVFMRNELPRKPLRKECGILNLDSAPGRGTHWVAWYKDKNKNSKNKFYFDSFGVQPPDELIRYLSSPIFYNTERVQPSGQVICGHLCLFVLSRLSRGESMQDIINYLF